MLLRRDAGIALDKINYINAHGTGTLFNDQMESRAIRGTFGSRADPIVASTKGLVGHTLGAAGAIEAVLVLASLVDQFVPASAGADPIDPTLSINVSRETNEMPIRLALSNSFAFGGSNVSLVFEEPQ